jgi:hypothetical protein
VEPLRLNGEEKIMTVPVVLTIAGFIAILMGILGGGVKAKEIEIPSISLLGRGIVILVGFFFLGLGLWLSYPGGVNALKVTPSAVPPTLTSTILTNLPGAGTETPPTGGTSTPAVTATPNMTSTMTATATLLPTGTPLPQPLTEIFPQVGSGEVFVFKNNGGELSNTFLDTPDCIHSGMVGLQFKYAMSRTANAGWGVQWVNVPGGHFDASGFSALTFWVRGSSGSETFQVGLKDTSGNEIKLESDQLLDVTTDWKPAAIPLSAFKGVNPARIENLNFGFNRDHGSGSICLDDIAFIP